MFRSFVLFAHKSLCESLFGFIAHEPHRGEGFFITYRMHEMSPIRFGRNSLHTTLRAIRTRTKLPSRISNSSRTALVTGGAGFIGSNLCRELLARGYAVFAVDNYITGRKENLKPLLTNPQFRFFKLDIVHEVFPKSFAKHPLDFIFHLACPTGVPNIEHMGEEMLLTSSIGTRNVLEIARLHRAKVIFTSSCEVYGNSKVFPQSEDYPGNVNPIGPRSPYEEGKRFSESLIVAYARKYGIKANIVRIFNTYGPGMSPKDKRVIPQFLRSLANGEPIRIYGNGKQSRTHLYIDDLIRGLLLVSAKGAPVEVYNIGGSKAMTVEALARIMMRITKRPKRISFEPHFVEDHFRRLPSVEKIKRLGWRQTVTLEQGMRRMIDSYGPIAETRGIRSNKEG